jgi:predicted TIM-barrel fold metal-dependent hydrolase
MTVDRMHLPGVRHVIDCDIHCVVPAVQALFPYLPSFWKEYIRQSAFKGPAGTPYPPGAPTSAWPHAYPANGAAAGTDLGLIREQVLDAWDAEYGILQCAYGVESVHNPDAAAVVASAVNDWQAAEWLDKEPRLRGSIVVPSRQPESSAREIDRVGGNPGFVQVYLPVRSEAPYGDRRYHPIFEAAARHDLVVGIHFGGAPGNPPTPSGWPSTYLEEYAGMAQVFQSQVISLIVEGVFDRFPTLRVALIEGGVSWMPSLMWRLDKEWKGLRREVPWVKRLPSEYIMEHVRLTTQPFDVPADSRQTAQIIDQLGSTDLLMFSTDYPHRHTEAPGAELPPATFPEPLLRKIMAENARAFYRL